MKNTWRCNIHILCMSSQTDQSCFVWQSIWTNHISGLLNGLCYIFLLLLVHLELKLCKNEWELCPFTDFTLNLQIKYLTCLVNFIPTTVRCQLTHIKVLAFYKIFQIISDLIHPFRTILEIRYLLLSTKSYTFNIVKKKCTT